MVLIHGTNIVIDEFNYGKKTPWIRYIYILTHFHGGVWNEIYLNKEKTRKIEVLFYDANHVPGSVIVLMRGYMGTILHTGDFRFHTSMIENYPELYPLEKRNSQLYGCSIHLDEIILDNTFCDPIFTFPPRERAVADAINIIEKHRGQKIMIVIYNWGKEELLLTLATYFNTKIVVTKERYRQIVAADFKPECFTTDDKDGWLYVLKGFDFEEATFNTDFIKIVCTGWVNAEAFSSPDGKSYYVPYSSHSNYLELEYFVKSTCPGILNRVVRKENDNEKMFRMKSFASYMYGLARLKQRGIDILTKSYVSSSRLSDGYKYYMVPENKSKINRELKILVDSEEKKRLLEDWEEEKQKRVEILKETREKRKEAWLAHQAETQRSAKAGLFQRRNIKKIIGPKGREIMMRRVAKESNKIDKMFKPVENSKEKDQKNTKKVPVKKKVRRISKPKEESKDNKKATPNSEVKLGVGIARIIPENLSDTGDSDQKDGEASRSKNPDKMDIETPGIVGKLQEISEDQVTKKVCKEIDKITLTELQ